MPVMWILNLTDKNIVGHLTADIPVRSWMIGGVGRRKYGNRADWKRLTIFVI
jgi:hypothetical protein